MAATAESRPTVQPSAQPNFWKRYSPRGECPMSFTGSALLHVLVPLAFVFVLWLSGQVGDNESARPPKMDMVEIEGGGGGLGDLGSGTGKGDPGKAERTDKVARHDEFKQPEKFDINSLKLIVPKQDDDIVPSVNPQVFVDPFDQFDQEQQRVAAILAKEFSPSGKAVGGAGAGGNSGGKAGKGFGNKTGPGQGDNPVGKVISQQRQRELRWRILASPDPDVHLKKLQAMKVLLVIPLQSKPGRAIQYDFAKLKPVREEVKYVVDQTRVSWVNQDPKEMLALTKALQLPEVPRGAFIRLPTELERDMAERELNFHPGIREYQIEVTVWDVRRVEDGYENVPYIVEQKLRKGIK